MCGIAGFVAARGCVNSAPVPEVLEQLKHRGPDDVGYLVYSRSKVRLGRQWRKLDETAPAEVVFLHRRLSILDLSEAGWQPMGTPDGRYFIAFNGEIYNFVELRRELEQLGFQFESRSDTEVLLAAYAAWGADALPRLIGMFAFAILDTHRRVVFLARDFFGIKPLYYKLTQDSLVFASELKTLLEYGDIARRANPERLFLYLRYGMCDCGSETLLSDVLQLPPAHYLEVSLDDTFRAHPVRYWTPETERRNDLSFDQAARGVQELFLNNVRLHLRSDVPVGSALSGGVDSSSIVMAMRHLEPKLDLFTFSYIADDEGINEEQWVDIVGSAARANVHKVHPTAAELVADFDPLLYAQDMPSGSTSPYAQYCVFRAARQAGIKVMLDGQGADEILGGYRYFLGARLASLIRQRRWREAANFAFQASRLPAAGRSFLVMMTCDYLLPQSARTTLRKLAGKELLPPWINQHWFREQRVEPKLIRNSDPSSQEVLKESLLQYASVQLPGLLRHEDRNSMAFSIESRVPFLTPQFVSYLMSLPEEYIIAPDGTTKAVFRQAMRGIVPDSILNRKDKIGFATPERQWLTAVSPWVDRLLASEAAADIPAFDLPVVLHEWQDFQHGRKDFSSSIWRCLNVIHWTEQFRIQYERV